MDVQLKEPRAARTTAVLGAGVIGTGWVLHFLRMGHDVRLFDPVPAARERMPRVASEMWPLMVELGLREGASLDRLTIVDSLEDLVRGVDVVQEAIPENADMKTEVFTEMDALSDPSTILLTSTSGISMTRIQSGCRSPERTAVGHPFNPPYLVPLVEVLGGDRTAGGVVSWVLDFYKSNDKEPILLEREVPAFIASRLQEAMWREALHMIANGEATVEQIDTSIRQGPGLRWAITGPIMNFHLAGGPGGIAHVLDHFGPTLKEPWTRLEAPELTDGLRKSLIDGCERMAGGRSVEEMIALRDRALVTIMRARDSLDRVETDEARGGS